MTRRSLALFREAFASARSSGVASTITVLMVIGMVVAVMLTTGRTVGAEQDVLGSIDNAGTRTVTIRTEQAAGVDTSVLERIHSINGIEWVGAFSTAEDVTNTRIPGGTGVPARFLYTQHPEPLGLPTAPADDTAYASDVALEHLGMPDSTGTITLADGQIRTVASRLDTPDFLTGLEPLVAIPTNPQDRASVAVIVLVVQRPDLVAPVSTAVVSVLDAEDPTKVTVTTSETLAQLRSLIEGQLGSFSRGLVLALLALTGALLAMILLGLVILRRKDFGRRRALGATRGFVIVLILTQTAILALLGTAIGTSAATTILLVSGDPHPGIAFTAGLVILTILTALLASLIPAVIASTRDPIRELRVP